MSLAGRDNEAEEIGEEDTAGKGDAQGESRFCGRTGKSTIRMSLRCILRRTRQFGKMVKEGCESGRV
jgi:hypothetical protein